MSTYVFSLAAKPPQTLQVLLIARLRTDLLDKRLLAMLLEISKELIYQTLVSGQPLRDF
jgi:hypothetical protein